MDGTVDETASTLDHERARLAAFQPQDCSVYPATQHPDVEILNPEAQSTLLTPPFPVELYDCRKIRINPQFADEIESARKKLRAGRIEEIIFHDEAILLASDVYMEMKLARIGGRFLPLSAGTKDMTEHYDPNGRHWALRVGVLAEPEIVRGRSIAFTGVGQASNFYHWVGEQMPRLALLAQYRSLSEFDNIVVFAKDHTTFIRESVKQLFPQFRGQIRHILGASVQMDEAVFFAPRSLIGDESTTSATLPDSPTAQKAWGSLSAIVEHIAARDAAPIRGSLSQVQGSKALLISRDGSNGRCWRDEAELLSRLRPWGVRSIRSEEHALPVQMAMFRQAKVVIAQHGAGLANILFCQPGTRIIEVTTRNHVLRSWDFAKLAQVRGLNYHIIVADARDDDPHIKQRTADPHVPKAYLSDMEISYVAALQIELLVADVLGKGRAYRLPGIVPATLP
ncbi:MAG: DUF563 domain-containing protein [Paracoccaceae bacterium]